MPDFNKHRIIWGGGHGLDRSAERQKPPQEVEKVVRTSVTQVEGRKRGRWEILGCIDGEWSRVIVQEVSDEELVVVTVYGEDKRC